MPIKRHTPSTQAHRVTLELHGADRRNAPLYLVTCSCGRDFTRGEATTPSIGLDTKAWHESSPYAR